MNGIALLIGLGPLLGWGLFPTIASKIGGKPVNHSKVYLQIILYEKNGKNLMK